MNLLEKLTQYAKNQSNVLMIGKHGVGKTTMVRRVADDLGMKLCYYSASTLDPWIDVVGVPKPIDDDNGGHLEFYRPQKIIDAEFLFFDELNRAQPKVLNAVLEIIQFKTVNSVPLPKLKMVWAAINPPGGQYDVEELDPALVDRFHVYLNVKAEFNNEYMKSVGISQPVCEILRDWWEQDMDANQRDIVTPRRLEYLGMMIDRNLDWKDCLPISGVLPVGGLQERLNSFSKGRKMVDFTKEKILQEPQKFTDCAKDNPSDWIKIQEIVLKFSPNEMFEVRDLMEAMPKDLLASIWEEKYPGIRKMISKAFTSKDANFEKNYPKIFEVFKLNE